MVTQCHNYVSAKSGNYTIILTTLTLTYILNKENIVLSTIDQQILKIKSLPSLNAFTPYTVQYCTEHRPVVVAV